MANTTPAPEARQLFDVTLESMRQHYLSGQRGDFFAANPQLKFLVATSARVRRVSASSATPKRATAAAVDDPPPIPDILKPTMDTLKTQQQSAADSVSGACKQAASNLQSNQNSDAFDQALDASRQQTLQDSTAHINAAFDQAKQLGHQNPDQQKSILNTMNVVSQVMNSFEGLISGVIGKVLGFAEDLLNGIESTVEDAISGFGDAVGGVLEFL